MRPGRSPSPSNFTRAGYLDAVRRAKDYIRAGDIFQVVPSQRWRQPFALPPFALYRALRRTNPSPFMFFFNFGGFQVVGASPEILVRVFGGEVTIRPIAGTRPRGATPEEDRALEAELLADEKELAEHLMLLDLGRNDVGRVARIGTVRPTEEFIVERYSHVMHIVSNVVGELSDEHDALSALLAGLPAGTVSGAPKVRAMQIIDELEPEKRGVYGGGSAISRPGATWTCASRCAPPWCRTARSTSRRAAAWSMTATPRPSSRKPSTRPARSARPPPRPPEAALANPSRRFWPDRFFWKTSAQPQEPHQGTKAANGSHPRPARIGQGARESALRNLPGGGVPYKAALSVTHSVLHRSVPALS
jgi:hypothetical protein